MNNPTLLPPGSSVLERRLAEACSDMADLDVPLRQLWDPETCPVSFLPYLAWARSVDYWDENWPEIIKRNAVKSAWFVHQHKGTIGAIRRVVEPLGYLLNVSEWWETSETPGTFRLEIGVLETGITEEMYQEMERLIADAKPNSRQLTSLTITQDITGIVYLAAVSLDAEVLTVFPG